MNFSLGGDAFALLNLAAVLLLIAGLRGLRSPRTAQQGNLFALLGMGLAFGCTFLHPRFFEAGWGVLALALGACVGIPIALRIQMTALPQLVAILHSLVGLSALCVGGGSFFESASHLDSWVLKLELSLGLWIGAITFTGSWVAFGKLQEWLPSAPWRLPGHSKVLLAGVVGSFVCGGLFLGDGQGIWLAGLTAIAFVLGLLLVFPIGGADMPVVVSMLNSYSGWAASATGFILGHPLLIMTGALVGSSGAILSYIMCEAMNRSFLSVLFGGASGEAAAVGIGTEGVTRIPQIAGTEDVAFVLENAQQVLFIPGYGMAVAQAQHPLKELYTLLTTRGVQVRFAIHPVAGRMPGHMNVLLAESDIPYDSVFEMDEINSEFPNTDVALVVGANDVVNPAAQRDPKSPLYGMPILEAYRAKRVFVIKRSLKAGYAGVDNDLFYEPHCSLVLGDAKKVLEGFVHALKKNS